MTTKQTQNHHVHLANMAGLDYPEREIEAKLAIAYEARTANLLAFRAIAGSIIARGTPLTTEFAERLEAADNQIIERLGLPNDN